MVRALALVAPLVLVVGCGPTATGEPAPAATAAPPVLSPVPPTAAAPATLVARAQPTRTPRPPTATPPLGDELAVIQAGAPVAPNDPLVRQFDAALDVLQAKCRDPRETLADYAVSTHDLMAKRGVTETYLSILQHVAASLPANVGLTSCDQVFAAYATLRLDGGR